MFVETRQYCLYTQHDDVPWSVWSGLIAVNGKGDWKLVSKESSPSAVSAITTFIVAHIKTTVHSCVLANAHKCPCFFLCFPFFHGEEVGRRCSYTQTQTRRLLPLNNNPLRL